MLLIDRLIDRINATVCPIVVGLDPLVSEIPSAILKEMRMNYGNTRQAVAESFYKFNQLLLESIAGLIPAVKLQMACYELYGSYGIEAFEKTVRKAKELGLIVIDDSKRNDIGSTAALYAMGHLGKTPLIEGEEQDFGQCKGDFLTINPLLGSDNNVPFLEECKKSDKGLFILARTSNPSCREYQEALIGKVPLYQKIAEDIHKVALKQVGKSGFSAIGAVVGATWPDEAKILRKIMPCSYFLVPGYGAQGAKAEDVIASFTHDGYGGLINSSRGIIFAYKHDKYADLDSFTEASRQAVIEMRDLLLDALRLSGKLPSNW
ncbi:MAG: orotidine-5'-phosphate decarboxylase [Proteobacteria bacterium]|nr:orotidine-5'-phosphate decarboxylase [Pseudomonadota bacterium]